MTNNEVMVDIETFGTEVNSVILAIGAIKFNRKQEHVDFEKILEKDKFFQSIQIDSCIDLGMKTNNDTVKWWSEQHPEVRKAVFDTRPVLPIKTVLQNFKNWYGNSDKVWSQGICFDIPILENAFKKCDIDIPWKFWHVRDSRTAGDIINIKNIPNNNKHHPLHDCLRQIYTVKEAVKFLK